MTSEDPSSSSLEAAASSSSSGQQKRVQVVGAPPPGPPIPKDDTHTDDEGDEDDDEDGASVTSQDGITEDKEADGEEVDLLANFEEGDENLELTHLNLKNSDIRKLQLSRFASHLKSLCLRQNLITKITQEDIGQLNQLEDLDLYDNSLEKTYGEVLKGCEKLESLDYSFNNIKHVSHIAHLGNLNTLYFVQNKISKIRPDDFDGPVQNSLTSLELGGNKLRKIEHLEKLTKLEELWLGKNKITHLENLSTFTNLKILSIQSNRITTLENLTALTNLEELYISHNGLKEISNISHLKKLRVLDVSGNQITTINNLEGLNELEEFWANDNQINTFTTIEQQLGPKNCPKLETVYLEGNPVQKTEGTAYRRKLILMLPQISQIDATFVKTPSLR